MHPIIETIQTRCGELCRLCPPLKEKDYAEAEKKLPAELFEILKICNGILELMEHPQANDGLPFVSGWILFSFDEICTDSEVFSELFSGEGTVFAGNGAGGYYVLAADGTVWLYEYPGEEGECVAESLMAYYSGLRAGKSLFDES